MARLGGRDSEIVCGCVSKGKMGRTTKVGEGVIKM